MFYKKYLKYKSKMFGGVNNISLDITNNEPSQLDNNKNVNHLYVIFKNAIVKNDMELVRKLLKQGININHMYEDGNTPLLIAVGSDKLESRKDIIRFLLENKANVKVTNSEGDSLLELVYLYDCEEDTKDTVRCREIIRDIKMMLKTYGAV
jgi:ankyrin repeat protein